MTNRVTLRKVNLIVECVGVFAPDFHNNLVMEGVEWGTADPLTLESQTLRRIGWYFRTAGTRLRELFFTADPRPAKLQIDYFPKKTLVIDLSIHSLDQLKAMALGCRVVWHDPLNPVKVLTNFADTNWTDVSLHKAIPPTAKGVFVTVVPVGDASHTVDCLAKSCVEEQHIESASSQVSPYRIRLVSGSEALQVRLVSTVCPVDILVRGWLETA